MACVYICVWLRHIATFGCRTHLNSVVCDSLLWSKSLSHMHYHVVKILNDHCLKFKKLEMRFFSSSWELGGLVRWGGYRKLCGRIPWYRELYTDGFPVVNIGSCDWRKRDGSDSFFSIFLPGGSWVEQLCFQVPLVFLVCIRGKCF